MKNRRALTLVELLAVIAIIGALGALLLPALQQARESGRRITCSGNMKQLAIAHHRYHDANRVFPYVTTRGYPPGNEAQNMTTRADQNCNQPDSNPTRNITTWMIWLWPHIDEMSLYDQFDFNQNIFSGQQSTMSDVLSKSKGTNFYLISAYPLPIYYCPSDRPKAWGNSVGLKCNYAANMGSYYLGRTTKLTSGPFGWSNAEPSPRAGSSNPGGNWCTFIPYRVSADHITDGLSNTMLLGEEMFGSSVYDDNDKRGGVFSVDSHPGFVARYTPNSGADSGPSICSSADSTPCSSGSWGMCLSRSRHQGGVTVAMCDGSVGFITDEISLKTWQALSTRAGGEMIDAPPF